MRRALITALVTVVVIGGVVALVAGSSGGSGRTYKIEMQNAFGLVTGAEFKVAGVKAGSIQKISLDQKTLNAVVTVNVTTPGLGEFHQNASCLSEPQSLIGEYFISCQPGTSGPVLRSGATIPVSRTESTIPADLLQNILRLPYRQRLSLILGELGAAVAGRSQDIQAALQRAVPALSETDNLLNLLGGDSATLKQLTSGADSVVTALANNSKGVQRFIVEANHAASDTATQETNLQTTLQRLPGFLGQLRPAMAKLGSATAANQPVLVNLNAASGQLDRLFVDLPAFSRSSRPAIKALGKASVTGRTAVTAAGPTVTALNQFATNTPDLAQNLAIVTNVLNSRKYAVEKNARSPGGQGYTGLEALLQFAFNLAAATNTYGPYGHQLAVDAFLSAMCTPYASAQTVESNLALFGSAARSCYAWLGPNQPGVNETDPSDPTACVPDPGGAPPGEKGPTTTAVACKAGSTEESTVRPAKTKAKSKGHAGTTGTTGTAPPTTTSGSSPPSTTTAPSGSGNSLGNTLGGILGSLTGSSGASAGSSGASAGSSGGSSTGGGLSSATQQLLNYLIAP
jgi:virulence factor Mce-like protein